MAISEDITVDAGEAIAEVNDLATAFEDLADKASAAMAKIDSALDGIGGGGAAAAGPDKLVAAWDKAADSVSAAADKIAQSIGRIGDIGAASSAAGPDKLAASWDDAAASISASVDKIAASGARIDDLGAGAAGAAGPVGDLGKALDDTAAGADKLAGAGAGAADGLKGIGDSAKESQAFLDEYNATLAETAAMAREASAASADASAKIAMSQRLNTAAMKDASDDAIAAQAAQADSAKAAAADADAAAGKYHMLALGGAAAVGYGIYEASKLQTQVVRLYTSAGESQKNLPMITQGILGMAGPTATDQNALAQGAYWVESAGFHGQSALNVLRSVAQGAYAEGAPIQDVANAATSIMTSYGMTNPSQQQSNSVINMMLQAVGHGKMTMAGLSAALPSVLPVASSAGLSLPQVLGSLATMTAPGMSADRASQNLAHTIGKLQNPTQAMTAEMYQLGLDPVSMAQNLGKTGISGEMNEIQAAIKAHTITSGADKGLVQLPAMNISKAATSDALMMLKQMPPAIQGVAKAYLDGKVSAAAWNQEMFKGSESASAKNLLQQFSTVANLAHGFNAALKAGQPDVQAYNAAVSKTLGDSVAMRTYLELTGQHAKTTAANIQVVSQAAKDAGQNVQGWADITKTAGYQLKSFEYSAKATATTMGAALLPAATDVMSVLAKGGSFLAGHPELTKDLALGGGALGALAILPKLASIPMTALSSLGKIGQILQVPGADKLANIGQGSTGAAALDTAAGSLEGSAEALTGAAEALSGAAGEGAATRAAGTAEGAEGAAAAEGAGAGSIGAAVKAALGPVSLGMIIGSVIKAAGDAIAPAGSTAGKYNQMLQKTPATNDSALMPSIFGGFEGKLMSSIGESVGKLINRGLSFGGQLGGSAGHLAMGAASSAGSAFAGVGGSAAKDFGMAKSAASSAMSAIDSAVSAAASKAGSAFSGTGAAIGGALKSAGSAASSAMNAVVSAVSGAASKADAAATSGFHAVVSAVSSAMSAAGAAAESGASRVVSDVASIGGKITGALAGLPGELASIGSAAMSGLASGIEAGIGAAVGAAEHAASAVEGAMKDVLKIFSPSKVTEDIGKQTSAGLAKGLTEGTPTVKASAVTLSASTLTSLTQGLQGGSSALTAALQAITGKGSQPQDITTITGTISTLKDDVSKALAAGQISKPQDSALVKMLTADNTKLQALSNQRAVLEQEITDSQQIAQQAISNASIMTAGNATPYDPSTVQSSYSLVQGMQYQAQQAQMFAQQVGQLKKEGLNATSLNQIVQSGASAGLPVAEGLTSGGKSAIAQVNKLQGQIKSSAAQLGNEGAGPMYQAGVQAAQGLASGIESQLGMVDSAIKRLADSMVSEIKSALKSHSPSQVFAAEGLTIPQGLAQGVDQGTPIAQAAVSRMGNSLGGPLSPYHPGLAYGSPASGGSSGAAPANVTIHMTIMGSVMTEHDLVSTVQNGLLKKGLNNWQAGLIPPGRAG